MSCIGYARVYHWLTIDRSQLLPFQDYESFKHYDRAKKIAMLFGDSTEPGATKRFQNPQEYISYLERRDLKNHKALNCIRSLRIELANNSVDWIQKFGHVGIDQILLMLRKSWNG